ncbi:NAD(P)H-binding protein [Glycomyces buryatensis]|uniref:NAD-dependent epimerase/dehydratase family protein n=1 Tax=Glycomyces buryatensis TaxID=2570927 RepID=A0A4S8QMB4_9ACTN|nr:NAD(P)H-binding protein [Glycomyces buryatensis]THV42559.1 NAD-dependent epimerase/dehydratase family protein [Glycomyces buryatensis]
MILVTGATGTVGRALVAALVARGADVRALTRDPAGAKFPQPVDIVGGNPKRPDTVAAALEGVEAVFLNSRAIGDAVGEFADLAKRSGVRRLVALAAYNVEHDLALQPSRFFGDRNRECEAAAEASGLEWVSLRPDVYANMALPLWGGQLARGDEVVWPYPDFTEAAIDPGDVAEVAARALVDDDLLGTKPVLTGPEAISHTAMVEALAEATGRPLRYREQPLLELVEQFAAIGLPAALTASFIARYAALEGQPATVTGEVERILGRPARSYLDWARDHAALFSDGKD